MCQIHQVGVRVNALKNRPDRSNVIQTNSTHRTRPIRSSATNYTPDNPLGIHSALRIHAGHLGFRLAQEKYHPEGLICIRKKQPPGGGQKRGWSKGASRKRRGWRCIQFLLPCLPPLLSFFPSAFLFLLLPFFPFFFSSWVTIDLVTPRENHRADGISSGSQQGCDSGGKLKSTRKKGPIIAFNQHHCWSS